MCCDAAKPYLGHTVNGSDYRRHSNLFKRTVYSVDLWRDNRYYHNARLGINISFIFAFYKLPWEVRKRSTGTAFGRKPGWEPKCQFQNGDLRHPDTELDLHPERIGLYSSSHSESFSGIAESIRTHMGGADIVLASTSDSWRPSWRASGPQMAHQLGQIEKMLRGRSSQVVILHGWKGCPEVLDSLHKHVMIEHTGPTNSRREPWSIRETVVAGLRLKNVSTSGISWSHVDASRMLIPLLRELVPKTLNAGDKPSDWCNRMYIDKMPGHVQGYVLKEVVMAIVSTLLGRGTDPPSPF